MKHSYSNDDTCFSIDVIDEILEEDLDALLDEGSKILHSIEGTLLEEEIFADFDEFMALTADENSDSDTKDPSFDKITINTDYKIKTSLEEPLTNLELKPLPDNLEYIFLEEPSFLPVIISSQLSKEKKNFLYPVLKKKHKEAFTWKTTNIPAQQIKPTLFDGIVISKKHDVISVVDEEETLILEEESRSKMLAKQNDPISKEKKINISPINYSELNKLSEDFGKHFVPQMQLSTEQAFWLPFSNPKSEQLDVIQTPIEIEVPKELRKVSLVKKSFQKLKNHLASFDNVVKVRTTPDAIIEGSWGFEHTKKVLKEEVIPFINSLRASFKDFENGLHSELNEVKTIFNQMEAVVEQYVQPNNSNVIALEMFKLDLEPLAPKVLKNRDAHIDYIKPSREDADTLWEIIEHARALRPLDRDLNSACMYVQRIQEVLVYIKDTCPSLTKPSEKLVAVTPLNEEKKVRFTEPATSSSNTKKQVDSHKIQDSNKHVMPSTGMKSSTSASKSQPSDNTKNNRIS
ncbi:hypothetical protein Tco_1531183 [Tanacetum coccineum]